MCQGLGLVLFHALAYIKFYEVSTVISILQARKLRLRVAQRHWTRELVMEAKLSATWSCAPTCSVPHRSVGWPSTSRGLHGGGGAQDAEESLACGEERLSFLEVQTSPLLSPGSYFPTGSSSCSWQCSSAW